MFFFNWNMAGIMRWFEKFYVRFFRYILYYYDVVFIICVFVFFFLLFYYIVFNLVLKKLFKVFFIKLLKDIYYWYWEE